MKKIMFNDRYGLTAAVLEGRKTMTRRNFPYNVHPFDTQEYLTGFSRYKVGEVVAIAQSYHELDKILAEREWERTDDKLDKYYTARQFGRVCDADAGWDNKMFVKPDLMPHHIRITNVTVERLQDISDEDCMKEGIEKVTDDWWTYDKNSSLPFDKVTFRTPREAFAALIDKISGKGTWNRNPFVFVYEFELNNDTARHCGKEQYERTDE